MGAGVAAIGMALVWAVAPAAAQDSPQDGELDAASEGEAIVVTGSRIVRRDNVANSPIVTIGQDAFENRGSIGVEDALNELPQFTPAGSSALASDAGTAFAGANAAPGAATVDLRGIGTNRTLVLVNGRRAQPANAALLVDLNTIPAAAIKNVEVITGGAASVYGADAIAGVVNFILRDDFEGLELNARAGIAEAGDAENFEISGLLGGNFAEGRGNAMLGVVFSDRKAAFNRKRSFYRDGWNDPLTQGETGGRPMTTAIVAGTRYGLNPDGSLFFLDDAANPAAPYKGPLNNLAGGAGFKLNPPTSSGTQELGYNPPERINNIPLSRWSVFGSATYDLTSSIEAFLEARYSHNEARAQSDVGTIENLWSLTIPYNALNDDPNSPSFGANQNDFHPVSAQLADALNASGETAWNLYRGLNFAGRLSTDTTSDIFQVTAGLRGDLGVKDWSWEVYGSHGSTSVLAQQPSGAISFSNLQQIVLGRVADGSLSTTVDGPYGQGWTNGSTFNPQTCTSGIPLFNADGSVPQGTNTNAEGVVISDDCQKYITLELNSVTRLEQNILEGTMQGGLFDLWAGEMRFALGGTYREAQFSFTPDSGNSAEQQSTNVINQIVLPGQTTGKTSVTEVFGELLIPLLSDLPLIKSFNLELGGRYSSYNNAGKVWTYKALGDWAVSDWLRLRGGYQRANRAPNIFEQFAPTAGNIGASQDACVNIDGFTAPYGNRPDNPNVVNVQVACEELILRDGGFDYVTLAEDPTAVAQDPALFPAIDVTRMSNHRTTLNYNQAFPYSIAITEGNTNLASEIADTITIGGVLTSPFDAPGLNRMTLSIDYYSIRLKGTIGQPNGQEIYSQCFDPQYNSLMSSAPGTYTGAALLDGNPYCALINRYPFDTLGVRGAPGSGTDRSYKAQFINKGGTRTSGIDIAFNWAGNLEDMGLGVPGTLNVNATANILLSFEEAAFDGAAYVDYKGSLAREAYDYKLYGTVSYDWNHGTVGLRARYLPSIDPSPFSNADVLGTDSYAEFNLFTRYELTERLELRAGIDNLFNAQPRIVGASALDANRGSTISIYDTIGRSYYFGLRLRM